MEKKNVLLQTNEYIDKYVALKSFKDATVIAHGANPKRVMEEASSNGHPDAVLVFVPDSKVSHIY